MKVLRNAGLRRRLLAPLRVLGAAQLIGGGSRMVRWKELLGVMGAVFLISVAMSGQTTTDVGQVRGVVKDPAQAAVPGAQVILADRRDKGTPTVQTDRQGSYVFRSLRLGIYVVEVVGKGFKNSASSPLKVDVAGTVTFDVSPVLVEIGQRVTVLADA